MYIISNLPPPHPWSLALPQWRFSPPLQTGAVLTTLDRCLLNVDMHWRSPNQIKFARVPPSQLPQRIIIFIQRKTLPLTAVPKVWEFWIKTPFLFLSISIRMYQVREHKKKGINRTLEKPSPRIYGFWTAIEYSLVDLDSLSFWSKKKKRVKNSSHSFFPASEELHSHLESNQISDSACAMHVRGNFFNSRGLNRLDEVELRNFQSAFTLSLAIVIGK